MYRVSREENKNKKSNSKGIKKWKLEEVGVYCTTPLQGLADRFDRETQ